MSKPDESAIRDHLMGRLDLVEPGLIAVAREHYLKNVAGAAGFLDILARDTSGQLVIIEIKRTDAAAREAIQELFKYAALLRQNNLLRDVEYRLVILSVEWHELLTPYSEFLQGTRYNVSAGKIILGLDGLPTGIDPGATVAAPAQRRFATRHFLWRFTSEDEAASAVGLIAKHMQDAGLTDFVLIQTIQNSAELLNKWFIYFAQQELTLAEYQSLIRRKLDDEAFGEHLAGLSELVEEQDRIAESADAVWFPSYDDLCDRLACDHVEISNPEKAAYWFAPGSQKVRLIERFGRFKTSTLSDDAIISDIVGHGGVSDIHLATSAATTSPPQIADLLAAIENVFFFNASWRASVKDLVAYAIRTGPAKVTLTAFSNDDVLRSIAGMAFGYPGFAPTFRLDIDRDGEKTERFIGLPEWNGSNVDADGIISRYFSGDPFGYFLAHHFGEHRGVNVDIMGELGLTYSVFREGADAPKRVRVQGASVVASANEIRGSISSLIEANVDEVHKIVELFMAHEQQFRQTITEWVNRADGKGS